MSAKHTKRLYDALTNLVQAVDRDDGVQSALAFAETVISEIDEDNDYTFGAPVPPPIDYGQPFKVLYEKHGLLSAVKGYRVQTDASLKEAKETIEEMAEEENWIRSR